MNMFDVAKSETDRIIGENGTAMLATSGNRLLDVYAGTTRIDPKNAGRAEITAFCAKIDACISSIGTNCLNKAVFCALGFYLRDVTEKGERTLFHIFFLRLWKHDQKLAQALMGFIVGIDNSAPTCSDSSDDADTDASASASAKASVSGSDPEYFGSWKDLHQILELSTQFPELGFTAPDYNELFEAILRFEATQLETDWKNFLDAAVKEANGVKGTRARVSLCAKWLVSAGKHFDRLKLKHGDKQLGYHAAFCAINASTLVRMSEYARSSGLPAYASWKKIKDGNFIGLQMILRKTKSALNDYMGTVERDMCHGTWSEIEPSAIPARNLAKHRRAFYNEKSVKQRKSTQYNMFNHPFGDRHTVSDDVLIAIEKLRGKVGGPEFVATLAEFKESLGTFKFDETDAKIVDRILCRLRLMHCVAAGTKVHGARTDIISLVTAAHRVHNAHVPMLASEISQWASHNPERALLHRQAEDKLKEINDAIEKVIADSIAALGADLSPKEKTELESKVRINLKRSIGLYDVSGSMESTSGSSSVRPIDVCLGLSYFITRLSVPVGITFHEYPTMFKVHHDWDFAYHINMVKGQKWGGYTNFVAAFKLILDYGIQNKLTQDQMPESLFVISDMQFDSANDRSHSFETMFETMEREFASNGYKLPLLVFWNVNGSYQGQSVGAQQNGVITISGFDPAIMKTIAECGALGSIDVKTGKTVAASPIETMITSLTRPRYMPIIVTVLEYLDAIKHRCDIKEMTQQVRGLYCCDAASTGYSASC